MPLGEVRAVGTHSHAWAQVRGWMGTHLPDGGLRPDAVHGGSRRGAGRNGDSAAYQAAVCAPVAAANHGLEVLADDIGDNAVGGHAVRARGPAGPAAPSAPAPTRPPWCSTSATTTRADCSSCSSSSRCAAINMSRLESRPTKESMGSYCFSIDIEGHVLDERVGEALVGLKRVCADVRFVGSYPAAHGAAVQVSPHTTDQSFADARAWLRGLRAQHES